MRGLLLCWLYLALTCDARFGFASWLAKVSNGAYKQPKNPDPVPGRHARFRSLPQKESENDDDDGLHLVAESIEFPNTYLPLKLQIIEHWEHYECHFLPHTEGVDALVAALDNNPKAPDAVEKARQGLHALGQPVPAADHDVVKEAKKSFKEVQKFLTKHGSVDFDFYFDGNEKNEGTIEWVTANPYLFGPEPPSVAKGVGEFIVNHILSLFWRWRDPSMPSLITLQDASKKFIHKDWWHEDEPKKFAYSFRLLRVFEGAQQNDEFNKPPSYYSKVEFDGRFKDEKKADDYGVGEAVNWLRKLTKNDLEKLNPKYVTAISEFLQWTDAPGDANLGTAMTKLNRQNAEQYKKAVDALLNAAEKDYPEKFRGGRWEPNLLSGVKDSTFKKNPNLYDAMRLQMYIWDMELRWPASKQRPAKKRKKRTKRKIKANEEEFDMYYAYDGGIEDEYQDGQWQLIMKLLRMELFGK